MQKHLIIGFGEIGKSLAEVLISQYNIYISDINFDSEDTEQYKYSAIHICFPHSNSFIKEIRQYKKIFKSSLWIIHSTVPVGTTKKCGKEFVHSPIRGMHPNLENGIRTFVKYFGGGKAKQAAKIFQKLGIKTKTFNKAETTELGKLLDTTYYATCIAFHDYADILCRLSKVDYEDAMTKFNKTYNEGYGELKPNVIRPMLYPPKGKIGGHCLIPNAKILKDQFGQSDFLKAILKLQ